MDNREFIRDSLDFSVKLMVDENNIGFQHNKNLKMQAARRITRLCETLTAMLTPQSNGNADK